MSSAPSLRPPPIDDDVVETLEIDGLPSVREILESVPPPAPSVTPSQPARRITVPPPMAAPKPWSLLAPPPAVPRHRGVALAAGLGASALVGATDVAIALSSTHNVAMSPGRSALAVLLGACAMLAVGVVVGLVGEVFASAALRLAAARRLWRWGAGGARVWFAPAPGLSARVMLVAAGALAALAVAFPAWREVVSRMHDPTLMAVAILCVNTVALAVGVFTAVVVAAPCRRLAERAPVALSPGGLVSGAAFVTAALLFAAHTRHEATREGTAAAVPVLVVEAALAVAVVGTFAWRRLRRRARAVSWGAFAAVVGAALALVAATGVTLGARQTVASVVGADTWAVGLALRGLRALTDVDRDGASALFNGGDCAEGDPRIHPRARDIPDNGVDEDCVGGDARGHRDDERGGYGADTGLARGVRPSFVFVTIDTLRRDHVGAYGYGRATTPHIDRFAARGVRFDQAWSTAPGTRLSMLSMFTGRYPHELAEAEGEMSLAVDARHVTVAESLRAAGYRTASVTNSNYFGRIAGFLQGFDDHRAPAHFKGEADEAVRAAGQWIDAHDDAPFFLWLHLIDPHRPFRSAPRSPRGFGAQEIDLYDEEIAHTDASLAPLLEAVERGNEARPDHPVVVILTADHGEGFGDHGMSAHGFDLHQEVVRVPLIVRAPSAVAGVRAGLVSLVDLHATVLDYAGLRPEAPSSGRSLVAQLRGVDAGRSRVFSILPHARAMMFTPPWTTLWNARTAAMELYDLSADPRQARNLVDARPDVAARLAGELRAWWAAATDASAGPPTSPPPR